MIVEITKEQFASWKENHVTEEVFNMLTDLREMYKEVLASGGTLKGDPTTDYIVGRIQGLNDILRIEFDEPAADYEH